MQVDDIFSFIEYGSRSGDFDSSVLSLLGRSDYNANEVAQLFFASKKESEISNSLHKINELQGYIDKVLKNKVTENYMTFIQSKDEVKQTGVELSTLCKLVDDTYGVLDEVRNNHLQSSKSMRRNSMMDVVNVLVSQQQNHSKTSKEGIIDVLKVTGKENKSSFELEYETKVPVWFREAPENFSILCVEKKHTAAVTLLLKVREYKSRIASMNSTLISNAEDSSEVNITNTSIENNNNDSTNMSDDEDMNLFLIRRINEICRIMDGKGLQFAFSIKDSIYSLPNSSIWGSEEQRRRLKMLITLGYFDVAAEAFSYASNDIIRGVLKDVEASGDTQTYITDLSKAFYTSLHEVTVSFLTLFAEHIQATGIMSILLSWAHTQIAALAHIISKQIQIGAKEMSAIIIIHMKPKIVNNESNNAVTFQDDENDTTPLSSTSHNNNNDNDKNTIFVHGPLSYAKECIEAAFLQASHRNALGLQGFADLRWLLVPELKKIITAYAEDLMRETVSQVKHDSWRMMRPRVIEISFKSYMTMDESSFHSFHGEVSDETCSSSFDWITACITHFFHEVWHLLKSVSRPNESYGIDDYGDGEIDDDDEWKELVPTPLTSPKAGRALSNDEGLTTDLGFADSSSSPVKEVQYESRTYKEPHYHRRDLCELEPVVVLATLRLILVYAIEIEKLEAFTSNLSKWQLECALNSINIFAKRTLPSIQSAMLATFFNMDGTSMTLGHLSNESSPNEILSNLQKRMLRLANRLDKISQQQSTQNRQQKM